MVIELFIAMFVTFVVHMLAELYDEESNRGKLKLIKSKMKLTPPKISNKKERIKRHLRNRRLLSTKGLKKSMTD